MIAFTVAALALAPIKTLPAYADYRSAVERCTPRGSWSDRQVDDLRTAFAVTTPDRHVTAAVEEQIAQDTADMHACLDDVGARIEAAMTRLNVEEAFGGRDPAPWLEDLDKRRRGAEREVRAHFADLGFRSSDAPRAAQGGFYYCQVDYYDRMPSGERGDHRSRIVSRIVAEGPDAQSKAQFLTDFHARAHRGAQIDGRPVAAFHEEMVCVSRPTMADIETDRSKASRGATGTLQAD